jgi:hypothetical protein
MMRMKPVAVLAVFAAGLAHSACARADSLSVFDRLSRAGLSLHRSFEDADRSEPARFGYVKAAGKWAEFLIDFLLEYRPAGNPIGLLRGYVEPAVSAEGHLASADGSAGDTWTGRLGLDCDWAFGGNGLSVSPNMTVEADGRFRTQYLLAELLATPTARSLALGKALPAAELAPGGRAEKYPAVQFLWRPMLGFAAGGLIRGDAPGGKRTGLVRISPMVATKLWLGFLAEALAVEEVYLYGNARYDVLPREDRGEHFSHESGAVFKFNHNASVVCTYSRGERAPRYAREERFAVALGVEF